MTLGHFSCDMSLELWDFIFGSGRRWFSSLDVVLDSAHYSALLALLILRWRRRPRRRRRRPSTTTATTTVMNDDEITELTLLDFVSYIIKFAINIGLNST